MSNPRVRQRANVQPPPNPAGPGNTRTLRHGADSEAVLAPLRAEHVDVLRRQHPHVSEAELRIQGQRLARIHVVSAWLEVEGIMRRGKGARKGEAWSVLRDLSGWERSAERWFMERRAEERERRDDPLLVQQELRAELERIAGERDQPRDAEVVVRPVLQERAEVEGSDIEGSEEQRVRQAGDDDAS